MIGFEFETYILMKARSNLIGATTPVVEGKVDGKIAWHISPDMRSPIDHDTKQWDPDLQPSNLGGQIILPKYSGYGDVEFITQPYGENEAGLDSLLKAIKHIQTFVDTLEMQGTRHNINLQTILDKVPMTAWGDHAGKNVKADDDIVVFIPNASQIPKAVHATWASVQMTAGIKLDKMPYLFLLLSRDTPESRYLLARLGRTWDSFFAEMLANSKETVKHSLSGLARRNDARAYNIYLGAVVFLAHILKRGAMETNLDQAKYLSPILSRTNLGKLAQRFKDDEDFLPTLLKVSGRSPNELLFPNCPNLAKITVDAWLKALLTGNDPISWGQTRSGSDPTRWNPQMVGTPSNEDEGHVFEFRAVEGQAGFGNWRSVAQEGFEIIAAINRQNTSAFFM